MKKFLFSGLLLAGLVPGAAAQRLSAGEKALITSGDTATKLRVIQIDRPGDSLVLKRNSQDINPADPLLPLLARRMYLAMRDTANPGVGIAAPQVGINRNLFWVQRFDKAGKPFELYLNPEITWRSALLKKGKEGCLSVPGGKEEVLRNYTIRVRYTNSKGQRREEMVEGYTAVIFQHETDHIRGTLFIDRLATQDRVPLTPVSDKIQLYLEQVPERL
ncbi:peptide deformylase [Taibaiella chishuiensis]|uniref:Peptide deformylase n=1 Tax=Taibaiella chishuiensis TaxID=1434707 RepID=A0A2P8DCI0_9BACT|nr:peptide deformylase [Taibaiella chishuiensis]PSK94926.1 peptide deformylase [Taibaiella chishuiensis]